MYLCNMTRKDIIQNGHSIEVQRLVKELPNDMDLGKAIRALTNKVDEQLNHLNEIPKAPSDRTKIG